MCRNLKSISTYLTHTLSQDNLAFLPADLLPNCLCACSCVSSVVYTLFQTNHIICSGPCPSQCIRTADTQLWLWCEAVTRAGQHSVHTITPNTGEHWSVVPPRPPTRQHGHHEAGHRAVSPLHAARCPRSAVSKYYLLLHSY